MNKFIRRIYSGMTVTCKNCTKSYNIESYTGHESGCGRPPCVNFETCGRLKSEIGDYCGDACGLLAKIKPVMHDTDQVFEILEHYKNTKAIKA